jgi:iron complex outermembrane receptor protein
MLAAGLFMLLAQSVPASAQSAPGQIAGIVRDVAGTPVAQVTISVADADTTRTTVTDQAGRFRFEGLPPRRYQLTARKESLQMASRALLLEPGAVVEVRVEMEPAFTDLVVVTATRHEQSVMAAPAAVSVVTSQDIRASAAENVPDLLRGVPGLNFAQLGTRDVEVNTRASTGILSNSMLVMVDGRSFFQPLYGAVYWDLLTATKDEIGQIEVLRSPASAVWGANALNGVINIRTKSPRRMTGLQGDVGFGERGTKSGSMVWAAATRRFSYKLSGSYFEQDAWDRDNLLPDGTPMPVGVTFENRGTSQPKFDARVDWDADPARVWSVRGGLAGANGLTHSALGPGEFSDNSYYSYLELQRNTPDGEVKVYWNRLQSPFRIVLFGLDEKATNDTYVADLTRRFTAGRRHHLTYGGALRLDRFNVTIAPLDRRRLDGAAFLEDSVSVTPAVNVFVGGRLDKFDTTSAVFAPRLGLVLTPKTAYALRLTYNRAYRAPSLLENFLQVPLPAVVPLDPPFFYVQQAIGSTELKMEKQDAIELGVTSTLGSSATVSATVYQQSVSNRIWFLPVSFFGPSAPPPGWPGDPATVPPLPSVFTFLNLGSVRDRGIELAGRVERGPMTVHGSYTFRDIPRLESEAIGLPLEINKPSRHQASAGLLYQHQRWTAGGDAYFTSKAYWADVFTQPFWGYTDSYLNVNARVAYRLRTAPWEIWFSAADLFDRKIKSHVFGDTVRRKVTAGIRWQLKQ